MNSFTKTIILRLSSLFLFRLNFTTGSMSFTRTIRRLERLDLFDEIGLEKFIDVVKNMSATLEAKSRDISVQFRGGELGVETDAKSALRTNFPTHLAPKSFGGILDNVSFPDITGLGLLHDRIST